MSIGIIPYTLALRKHLLLKWERKDFFKNKGEIQMDTVGKVGAVASTVILTSIAIMCVKETVAIFTKSKTDDQDKD
tara:strand:+ start:20348 stop:20575 length:228 start_codon:yes stop_codon:yes gene_type:complete